MTEETKKHDLLITQAAMDLQFITCQVKVLNSKVLVLLLAPKNYFLMEFHSIQEILTK